MGALGKRKFKFKTPIVREAPLHRQIADVLRLELGAPGRVSRRGVTWWSIDMSNFADVAPGLRTGRGAIAGVPDLQLLHRGRAFFIELKAEDGILSEAQRGVATCLACCDVPFGVARDVDEVLQLIDAWEIPREHRVMA